MTAYENLSGQSNVIGYELGDNYITVEFKNRAVRFYKYTYLSAGNFTIEHMKNLAAQGRGLSSFINTDAKRIYDTKW